MAKSLRFCMHFEFDCTISNCSNIFLFCIYIFFLSQSHPLAPLSSSRAPQARLTVFLWPGVAMATLNVMITVMRTTAPSAPPFSSSVIKECALMLRGVAMVNLTVQMSLMSMTVKVGLYCLTYNYTYLNILTCRVKHGPSSNAVLALPPYFHLALFFSLDLRKATWLTSDSESCSVVLVII